MGKFLLPIIFMALGFLTGSLAVADGPSETKTGQACKAHLKEALLTPQVALALKGFKGSPYKTPSQVLIQDLKAYPKMGPLALHHVTKVRKIMGQCVSKCEGLLLTNKNRFECHTLKKELSFKDLQRLTKSNKYLSDTTEFSVEPIKPNPLQKTDRELGNQAQVVPPRTSRKKLPHQQYWQRPLKPTETLIEL